MDTLTPGELRRVNLYRLIYFALHAYDDNLDEGRAMLLSLMRLDQLLRSANPSVQLKVDAVLNDLQLKRAA